MRERERERGTCGSSSFLRSFSQCLDSTRLCSELRGDDAVEVVGAEVERLQHREEEELGSRELAPNAERDEEEGKEAGERGEQRVGGWRPP
jgi:hypothetical protein